LFTLICQDFKLQTSRWVVVDVGCTACATKLCLYHADCDVCVCNCPKLIRSRGSVLDSHWA